MLILRRADSMKQNYRLHLETLGNRVLHESPALSNLILVCLNDFPFLLVRMNFRSVYNVVFIRTTIQRPLHHSLYIFYFSVDRIFIGRSLLLSNSMISTLFGSAEFDTVAGRQSRRRAMRRSIWKTSRFRPRGQ